MSKFSIHIQSMQFPFITHGMVLYINDSIYRQNTNIEKMYVHASELRKFRYFYILKLLFLSIFCRYIRYSVGTNDMHVGLHVPTNFPMYRQISKCTDKSPKRHYWGGGGQLPPCPPPPPLATLMPGSSSLGFKIHSEATWALFWSILIQN